jgi:hypothetical protein
MRHLVPVLAALLSLPAALAAQGWPVYDLPPGADRRPPSRWSFGVHALNGQPVGDFGRAVNTSWGGAADVRWHVAGAGFLSLRADAGLAGYGRRRTWNTVGLFGEEDVTTQNSYGFLLVGAELAQPDGPIRPYLHASAGGAYFATVTNGARDDGFMRRRRDVSRTHVSDLVPTTALGGGIRFELARGRSGAAMLDVGARRWFTGPATYATREDVTGPALTPTVRTRRGPVEQWLFSVGISVSR